MSVAAAQAAYASTEGDVDRVVVESWLRGTGYEVLPKRNAPGARGKAAAVQTLHALLTQGMTRLVLALDLDEGSEADLRDFVEKTLRSRCTSDEKTTLRVDTTGIALLDGRAALLPVGLPTDARLGSLGVTHHSVEDYLIVALHDDECLSRFATAERKNVRVPSGLTAAKDLWNDISNRVRDCRARGFELKSAKSVLQFFCALVGFPARASTLAERLIEVSAGTPAEALFRLPSGFMVP